ncbi:MAG: hypothetical protein JW726_19155 [Anaerolineales bacterium]|nr:hypothetical protein [Anaerolineales bacterium]
MDLTEFFITFPRKKVAPQVTRRELVSAALSELEGASAAREGRRALRLSDLGELPDEILSTLIPQHSPDRPAWEQDGQLYIQPPQRQKPQALLPLEPAILFCFRQIDGLQTLGQIAESLANLMDWEPAKAFAYLRGFFLTLVFYQACIPRNPTTTRQTTGDSLANHQEQERADV